MEMGKQVRAEQRLERTVWVESSSDTGKLSSLKLGKKWQKRSDRSWWKSICYNGLCCRSYQIYQVKDLQLAPFQPLLQWYWYDCARNPLMRLSLTKARDNLARELLSGEAAADHTAITHYVPYDFTILFTIRLKWTESHFFLRLSTNPRDVAGKHVTYILESPPQSQAWIFVTKIVS